MSPLCLYFTFFMLHNPLAPQRPAGPNSYLRWIDAYVNTYTDARVHMFIHNTLLKAHFSWQTITGYPLGSTSGLPKLALDPFSLYVGVIGKRAGGASIVKPLLRQHDLKCADSTPKNAKTGKTRPYRNLEGRSKVRYWSFRSLYLYPYNYPEELGAISDSALTSTAHPIPEARPHPSLEAVEMAGKWTFH